MPENFREQIILGRTGLQVSRLGIGSGYGVPARAVEKAFHEHGINYFLWSGPRRSGMRNALRNLAKTDREKIVIVLQTYDHHGAFMRRFVNKGLKSLKIDYADVLLMGWRNRYPRLRVMDKAVKLLEDGKIRFLAMSGHNRSLFGKIAEMSDSLIDIFMIRYNAANRGAEQDIFPHLSENNRPGITVYTATRWGKLMKQVKMPPGEKPLTAAECYRFVLSNPHVDLCFMGPKNEQQLNEGLKALDATPLSKEEMERIKKIGDHVHG